MIGRDKNRNLSLVDNKIFLKKLSPEKDITIKGLKSQVQLKSQLIDAKNETIDDCNATIAKDEKQKKLLKFGWISSIVFLGGIMTYIMVLH